MTDEEGAQLLQSLKSQAQLISSLLDLLVAQGSLDPFSTFALIGPEHTEDPHPGIAKVWADRKESLRLGLGGIDIQDSHSR